MDSSKKIRSWLDVKTPSNNQFFYWLFSIIHSQKIKVINEKISISREIFIADTLLGILITQRLRYMFQCFMFLRNDFLLLNYHPAQDQTVWLSDCIIPGGEDLDVLAPMAGTGWDWQGLSDVLPLSSPGTDWQSAGHSPAQSASEQRHNTVRPAAGSQDLWQNYIRQ